MRPADTPRAVRRTETGCAPLTISATNDLSAFRGQLECGPDAAGWEDWPECWPILKPMHIRVLGFVLAGTKETRLFPLTQERAKPAFPSATNNSAGRERVKGKTIATILTRSWRTE